MDKKIEIKAVIFDLDGVLLKSEKLKSYIFKKVLRDYGINVTEKDIKKHVGKTTKYILETYYKDRLNKKDIDKIRKRKTKFETNILAKRVPLYPKVRPLLKFLKKKDISMVIATGSLRKMTEKALKRLKIYYFFDEIVCIEDYKKSKPSPDVFLEAFSRLRKYGKRKKKEIKKENTIVVEDAIAGIVAAHKAGLKCLAIATNFSESALRKAKADYVVKDHTKLFDFFKNKLLT